jgi:poly(3-hydroxybutyrate) depolymerase
VLVALVLALSPSSADTGLAAGDLVTLLNDEDAVKRSFGSIRYNWDNKMSGMLGHVYQILETVKGDIAAIPSADGSQGGKWYFNTKVLSAFMPRDRQSRGCFNNPSPVKTGETTEYSGLSSFGNGAARSWGIYIPSSYKPGTQSPLPLVVSLHGFSSNKLEAEEDSGLSEAAELHGFIVVYPQGMADSNPGIASKSSASWHAGGSADSPGPKGPICDASIAGDADNCYASCEDRPGGCADTCDWTTCVDDVGFIGAVLDSIESTTCVNLDQVSVVGFSNGAMLAYELAAALPNRLSAAVAIGGSPHVGFMQSPTCGCAPPSIMAISGTQDDTMPANTTKSANGYYYTLREDVLGVWRAAHGVHPVCAHSAVHIQTPYDGLSGLYCTTDTGCAVGANKVVECNWEGGHDYPPLKGSGSEGKRQTGELLWWFLQQHNKNSPPITRGTVVLSSQSGDVARANLHALTVWLAVRCSMLLGLVLLLLAYAARNKQGDDDQEDDDNMLFSTNRRSSRRGDTTAAAASSVSAGAGGLFGFFGSSRGGSRSAGVEARRTGGPSSNDSNDIDTQLAVSGADHGYERL